MQGKQLMITHYFDPLQKREKVEIRAENYVLEHFKAIELACACCQKIRLAAGFANHLVVLRLTYGRPMLLTSCCRCSAHNQAVGGHPNSAHLCDKPTKHTETVDHGTCGIDVANPSDRLIKVAMALGWSVGIAQTFVHLDRIADYSQLKNYQRLYFYSAVSLGPREHWTQVYPQIQAARKTLEMSWES